MRTSFALVILAACLTAIHPHPAQAASPPLRIFIRAGAKTHGPGQHDSPQFLADWKALLKSRGAVAQGAQRFPTAAELASSDVLLIYAADGGDLAPDERARLQTFLQRGGGLVVVHDGVVSHDPTWFKSVAGGAFQPGHSKFYEGKVGLYFDSRHPITAGVANHFLDDEIYWDLQLDPAAQVIAQGFRTVQEITPQMWVYEKGPYRAFVSIPGHQTHTFTLPQYRALLLRGISWTARRPVDSLVSREELASLAYPEGGPISPARSRATIQVPADFDMSLVAAEPDVVKPVSLDWDARGRLWVDEMPQYPNKAAKTGQRGLDKIVILEDTNKDGRWDRRKVFCDGLDLANSFVFYRDGVIVSQPPELLFLRDTNGDDVCDVREVLFSGFGLHDTHAVTSNLRWGMDGWIYGEQGYSGNDSKDIRNRAGVSFGQIGNGIFRFRPDGSAIEMVTSFGGNSWGLDFSWDGELFFSMANGSHLRHLVVSDRVLGRGRIGDTGGSTDITDHHDVNPLVHQVMNAYVQIDHVGGFTAASGGTLYDGGAWPASYRNAYFVSEPTVNLVHTDVLRPAGVTYQAVKKQQSEFIASLDLWFRPVETRVGPDGALYIGDFYNLAAVHNDTRGPPHGPFNAAVRPDRDHEHGRIWRVQHKQAISLPQPDLQRADAALLVATLEHPNRWQRMTAQRLLVEQGQPKSDDQALAALLAHSPLPYARVHALWIRQQQGLLTGAEIATALRDVDPAVRKTAAAAVSATGAKPDGALVPALLRGLDDSDARVKLNVMVALGTFAPRMEISRALVKLFPQLGDDWSRSAVVAAVGQEPVEALAFALRIPGGVKMLPLVDALAALVADRGMGDTVLAALRQIAQAPASAAALQTAALLRLNTSRKLEGEKTITGAPKQALVTLLRARDRQVAAATLSLATRWAGQRDLVEPIKSTVHRLNAAVADGHESATTRSHLLRPLLQLPDERARALQTANQLLAPSQPMDLQLAVIEAVGATSDLQAAQMLVMAFPRLSGPARQAVVERILRRPDWTGLLVERIEKQQIRPQDLGPAVLFRLRNHPDKALAQRAGRAIDAVQGPQNREKDEIIAQLLPVVTRPGNASNGKEQFTKNCLVCHSYRGEGAGVAPDLAGMGARGPGELLVHIIDPNRAVEPNYVAFDVSTKNGTAVTGIIARETADSVVLRNATGQVEIKRSEIATMTSSGLSLMPDGFEGLGGETLRDILTYLCGEAGVYRTLDLGRVANASTQRGLYGREGQLRLASFGPQNVDHVLFQLVDPGKSANGNNALVLGDGGTTGTKTAEIPVGFPVKALHVLGGIANGTGAAPAPSEPIARLTYRYVDGKTEQVIWKTGVEFASWDHRVDVPGSQFVPGLLPEGVRGQLRQFTVEPHSRAPIEKVTLENVGTHQATFLALTAELPGDATAGKRLPQAKPTLLLVGGGTSHDFDRWWKEGDRTLLGQAGVSVTYTAQPADIQAALPRQDVLYLANNQPLPGTSLRQAIFDFVGGGKGLLLAHPALWYNWADWPDYNKRLVGGGARSHENYAEIEVVVVDKGHPLTQGLPESFRLKDELYRFAQDSEGSAIKVLAVGRSLTTGTEYPVVWTVQNPAGRIVCITLGHDGSAHDHPAYRKLITNSALWLARRGP